jgi:2-iminobutanoate/2-iminopropanoate deaminase
MKEAIFTPNAPVPIGPFSQAVKAYGVALYVSGNIGIKDGALVAGGVREQTHQAFKNIEAVLQQAGYAFADVVKVNVFLKSMDDFAAMNEVYATHFTRPEPARTTVEVSRLPLNAIVEIELTAVK